MSELSAGVSIGRHVGLGSRLGRAYPVLASNGLDRGPVNRLTQRTAAAYRYLSALFDYRPDFALVALGPGDWVSRSPYPVYGVPSSAFWEQALTLIEAGAPEHLSDLTSVYSAAGGASDLGPFFDLLPVHELAHAFITDGPLHLPRRWLEEFACNLLMHGYVAAEEPAQLPVLLTFPAAIAAIEPPGTGYRSLADFDTYAENMDAWNYGWYQCRTCVAAARVHISAGPSAARRLWDTFLPLNNHTDTQNISDQELTRLLDQAHPAIGDLMRHW